MNAIPAVFVAGEAEEMIDGHGWMHRCGSGWNRDSHQNVTRNRISHPSPIVMVSGHLQLDLGRLKRNSKHKITEKTLVGAERAVILIVRSIVRQPRRASTARIYEMFRLRYRVG